MLATRSANRLICAIGKGVFIAAAGSAMALGGAAAAGAQPGIVDAQSGSTVDSLGTDGNWDFDGTQGTHLMALSGEMRALTNKQTAEHTIVSDACHIKNKGCMPVTSFNTRTIQAFSGTSNDADSAMDADGFQTSGK